MLTKEENDLVTRVGPGTPCGELMRRYWQPAALSEELPPGGSPLPVRLLGEDLVLFRDDQGRPGLLALHCSHRGADLSYGRIEDGGLRCIYHGWLYDVGGRCVEQPGEPEGSTFHQKIRHAAYPCQERGGLIFAYMGPGDPPLLPAFEFLQAPEERRFCTKMYQACNYLQGVEGNLDAQHHSFLHRILPSAEDPHPPGYISSKDVSPTTAVDGTDFGIRLLQARRVADDQNYVETTNFVIPNMCPITGHPDGYSVNWHVPIDDTHHLKYYLIFRRTTALDIAGLRERRFTGPGYALRLNAPNRYVQDRAEMAGRTFAGLGTNFFEHDAWATEGQGPIQDRTQEHLGSGDRPLIELRKVLSAAIRAVQEGRDPPNVVRDPDLNHFERIAANKEFLPASADWRSRASTSA